MIPIRDLTDITLAIEDTDEDNEDDEDDEGDEEYLTDVTKDERFVSRYIANAIYCIIWKYRDIAIFRKYRDTLAIFSVHDIGQF